MTKNIFKISKYLCVLGLGLFSFSSCDKFEGEPLDRNQEENIWSSQDPTGNKAYQFLHGIYLQIPDIHNRINNSYLDSSTDDGVPSFETGIGTNVNAFRNGGISPSNVVDNQWKRNYTGIRRANIFLNNIDDVFLKAELEPERIKWKGEAKFLRAFYYFELAKRWGGVPLVGNKVFSEKDDVNTAKSTFDEVVQYIISELDESLELVSDVKQITDAEVGRINKGIVKALKSRVLLYWASPLNNHNNDIDRWKAAAAAAKEVIDLGSYDLNNNFNDIFTDLKNKEVIFASPSGKNEGIEWNNSPVGYAYDNNFAHGKTSPSQNLVDAFLTMNGLPINEDANYDPQNPYINRDGRLAATIFYNGSRWLQRDVETFDGGLDKPNLLNRPQTKTGYYLRKFLGNFEESGKFQGTQHGFVLIRYAEILLNYAEALNEVDFNANKKEIEQLIFKLRKRAGIYEGDGRYGLPADLTQESMRKLIHNERRIELAFEEHRFWDLRRWKEAEVYLNQPIEGVDIISKDDGSLKYIRKTVMESMFDASRMYWYPIPLNEFYSNTKLEQNPNWNY